MNTAMKMQPGTDSKSIDSIALAKAAAAYNILTNSKMRREQPSDPWKMKETMASTIAETNTIKLSGFWGGFKENETGRADEADITALDRIKQTVEELKKLEIDVNVHLLFSDNTGKNRSLGRTKNRHTKEYFEDIKTLAEERGFTIEPFSNYINKFDTFNTLFFYKVSKRKKRFENSAGREVVDRLLNAAKEHTDVVSNKPKKIVKICNNYIKYRISETMFMDKYFKDTVFFAYGFPYKDLFTDRTIFWYSIKKGVSAQPWFIDGKKFDMGKWFAHEEKNSLYYDWLEAKETSDKIYDVFDYISNVVTIVGSAAILTSMLIALVVWVCPEEKRKLAMWGEFREKHPKVMCQLCSSRMGMNMSWRSPRYLQYVYDKCLQREPWMNEEDKKKLSEIIGLAEAKKSVEDLLIYLEGLTPKEREEAIEREFIFSHTSEDSALRCAIRMYWDKNGVKYDLPDIIADIKDKISHSFNSHGNKNESTKGEKGI